MKTNFRKFLLMFAAMAFIVSCNNDDDSSDTSNNGIQDGDETGIDCGGSTGVTCPIEDILEGDITGETTLDASITYKLSSALVVKDGGKLTIPAGTVIKATGGTSAYIAVAQGGQIFVNGTADKPVVMTSGETSPTSGNWGGLVLAGKAPTNKGTAVTSEVGGLSYGGNEPGDSSGSITYLRVEYTGALFTGDKEFNGVSLFAVGSGTTFEYVQSYNGGDDGIEFFGGTVTGKYLVSTNSEDDGIDFADGWQGNGENWYITGAAKAGVEGSNNGDNGAATPMTTTTLKNISVVGPVTEGTLYFKEGGGKFTIDNLYASGVDLGVKVKDGDTDAAARIEAGDLTITNLQFANTDAALVKTDYTGETLDFFIEGLATGAGKGAAAPDWAAGWTKGLSNSTAASENLQGDITTEVSLNAAVEYFLTSALVVEDGGKLTIPAGTVIKASGGTSAYIAVAQGGQIFVNGTATNPVVMTSSKENPASGDWGGLVLAGKAPTNKGVAVTSEVGGLSYGGTESGDSSGSITYLRVEYTGAIFTVDKEFNGVSLFGVGSGTTFEYVQSYNGSDDGIEFFGGTVTGKYLVSTNSEDDGIDFADGWQGNGENWYITGAAKAGVEGSNNGDNGAATPITTTTLKNISVVGPVTEGALYFKEGGGKFTIENFYTTGINLGVKYKSGDTDAAARIEAGDLSISPIQFASPVVGFVATDYTGANQSFYTTGDNTGAGNGAAAPEWTAGWTKF